EQRERRHPRRDRRRERLAEKWAERLVLPRLYVARAPVVDDDDAEDGVAEARLGRPDDEAELDLDVGLLRRPEPAGAQLAAGPDDVRAGDDDGAGPPVVADGQVAPVRQQRLPVGPEAAAQVLGVLARHVEVDEVGDGERELERNAGERVAHSPAAG